jgi:DnaJ-domain-containing protein 1
MICNPLIIPILQILKETTAELSAYELIQKLEYQSVQFPHCATTELALFKKNFLLMNALYFLQNDLFKEGYFLTVSSLVIKIEKINQQSNRSNILDHTNIKLSEYYLDWKNYAATTQQDVNDLLNGFWNKYFSRDKKMAALSVLGLQTNATLVEVKQAYRRLAALHHPDKGGNQQKFIETRAAYEILKYCY